MNGYYIYVLGTLGSVMLTSGILMFYYKKQLTTMAGMVLAMVIGMNIGLTIGVFFGQIFQGNLYLSTVLSILIGMIAGLTCGAAIGILASLEGLMAGLMGAMMGAMVGEMITVTQAWNLLNIFLTLSVSSLLLFKILPDRDQADKINKKWIGKPLFTFILLAGYLMLGNYLNESNTISKSQQAKDSHKMHGGNVNGSGTELTINIPPSQFSYDPSTIIVKRNQKISLILNNNDSIEHDLEIKKIPLVETTGKHQGHGSNSDFHLHAAAKKQSKLTFTPSLEGTYTFYCTIPGHKESGMFGELVVQ